MALDPSLIVSAIGGLFGASGQRSANKANAREAQKNRDFQQSMSSSAHQREVKDLRAAGLNPILSATGGSGSSTPSGATSAPQQNVSGAGLSSAMQAAQIANIRSNTEKVDLENDKNRITKKPYQMLDDLFGSVNGSVDGSKVKDKISETIKGAPKLPPSKGMQSASQGLARMEKETGLTRSEIAKMLDQKFAHLNLTRRALNEKIVKFLSGYGKGKNNNIIIKGKK